MASLEHRNLLERIRAISSVPEKESGYSEWVKATNPLQLLRDNATQDELIICTAGPFPSYTWLTSVILPEDDLLGLVPQDLLDWSCPFPETRAAYTWGSSNVWIEDAFLDNVFPGITSVPESLVFHRYFQGTNRAPYFELRQEYLHLNDIHWVAERKAYCRFDALGDWRDVVTITAAESTDDFSLVTFRRDELEQYLVTRRLTLVRMFDFTLFRPGEFTRWPSGPEQVVTESNALSYRQKVDPGKASYTRGVQIVRPSRPKRLILSEMTHPHRDASPQYCDFVAYDWRNATMATISTDPEATTNYFVADQNSLPFELSYACFRPEVLAKYKADTDKYQVDEERRMIDCRGGWSLRGFDTNEAGQVHAYICDLRNLPYQEQLYWKSFNESPRADISQRAVRNDFLNEPADAPPLAELLALMRDWDRSKAGWWQLRDRKLLQSVNSPAVDNADEWARAIADLDKLVIEGFSESYIRHRLDSEGGEHSSRDRSLALLEQLLIFKDAMTPSDKLDALREIHHTRSKVGSHARGKEAEGLRHKALLDNGTFKSHFDQLCTRTNHELRLIERSLEDNV